ncbi:MAG: six-hairpin glycosidase, partial [Bacteroidales bacterium]|nr:six-hairpin glycosidase [Bacteroidales bacterium]
MKRLFLVISVLMAAVSLQAESKAKVLKASDYKHYVEYFNRMEDEPIVQAIPNAEAWNWMEKNIPLFTCPQDNFEEMWYFRWWSLRKGLQLTPQGYVVNEFKVKRSYADKYNMIACAVGHHINELRWIQDQSYIDQYLHIWLRGNEGKPMNRLMKFSSWIPAALYDRYLVHQDKDYLMDLLPDLEAHYQAWDIQRWPEGLYWQGDVQDGMEESISGGRRIKNARPTINSYMYGNAVALSEMFEMAGNAEKAALYQSKADTLRHLVQTRLWSEDQAFFETRRIKDGELAQVREAIGYIPWIFYLPESGKDYEKAWLQVCDTKGFLAPYGLTTAERRHPEFRTRGVGKCEWDGAIWPFASAQTLTAMANVLNDYPQSYINDSIYFMHMNLYVESQYHRGRPYIGEYLDEVTGYWLKGDQLRSRYYNHSTFADLMVTGLMGLRPRQDNVLEVNPLVPENQWDWFCMDGIPYHG